MKYLRLYLFMFILLPVQAFADEWKEADTIFDWFESKLPVFFSPVNQETYEFHGYLVRYYSKTDTYLGVKDGQIYLYGDVFNGLLNIGDVKVYLPLIGEDKEECIRIGNLTWELKDSESGLRNRNNTYTWSDYASNSRIANRFIFEIPTTIDLSGISLPSNNEVEGKCTGSRCTVAHYIKAINKEALCGYSDWRLPTAQELEYLFYNKHLLPNLHSSGYWSKTKKSSSDSNLPYRVHFFSGNRYHSSINTPVYIRLVR